MPERNNRAAGPLRNLASHVPAEWWRTLFGALYLRTDGDVVENDQITAQEVDVLVAAAALSHRHRILDLCCGQGRHALELAGADSTTSPASIIRAFSCSSPGRGRLLRHCRSRFARAMRGKACRNAGSSIASTSWAIRSAISTILRTTAACSKQHGARSSRV